jgi:hypothetical protein
MIEHENTIRIVAELDKLIQDHSANLAAQRARGVNDFNPFLIVRNMQEEEGLHSRFLHHLLDPHGDHGQGDLFIRNFFDVCGLQDLNWTEVRSFREYRNIDIYIRDNDNHVIIENKVYAGDQETQIERYINTIIDENPDTESIHENITVIYLSLDKPFPSIISLGSMKLKDGNILHNGLPITLKSIHYKNEIYRWVEKCFEEVYNITNLSIGLRQYLDVLERLNNTYEEKLMNIYEYIKNKEGENKYEIIRNMRSVSESFEEVRSEMMREFFSEFENQLNTKLNTIEDRQWEIAIEGDLSTSCGFPFRIYDKNIPENKVFFALEFAKKNYINPFVGIVRKDKSIDLSQIKMDSEIEKITKDYKSSPWWLAFSNFSELIHHKPKGNFNLFEVILDVGLEKEAGIFADKFFTLIQSLEMEHSLVTRANDILGKPG